MNKRSQRERENSSDSSSECPESILIRLTRLGGVQKIQYYLNEHQDLDLTKIKADNYHTLLHLACMKNELGICQIFFAYLTNNDNNGFKFEDLKVWVNSRTSLGQTALHFASKNGNLALINLLEEYGANIHIKDNEGLTMIHAAAQGDQLVSLAYFNSKGLNLSVRDKKGRTPLHLAADLGKVDATNYLTTKDCLINLQDSEYGYTPLHYAVKSGNEQVVKRLLIKGAATNIRDLKGYIPYDLALVESNYSIANLFEGKNRLLKCVGVKNGSSKRKSSFTFFLCLALIILLPTLHVLFVFPFIEDIFWVIGTGVFSAVLNISFLLTWLTDPGFIRKSADTDILSLLRRYEPHQICADCKTIKLPRSKHCETCEACVSVYDHHCTWVNNCIGAKNHKYFIAFIGIALNAFFFLITMDIFHCDVKNPVYSFGGPHLPVETLLVVKDIVCYSTIIVGSLFVIPLIVINYIQLSNLKQGKTTSERFKMSSKRAARGGRQSSEDLSEDLLEKGQSRSRRSWTNFMNICCRNAKNPRYFDTNTSLLEDTITVTTTL